MPPEQLADGDDQREHEPADGGGRCQDVVQGTGAGPERQHRRDHADGDDGLDQPVAQLDEVRLPLHILLETRFGDLNENQEELLRDARTGADAMNAALRRLAQVVDADCGALPASSRLTSTLLATVTSVKMLPITHSSARGITT